MAIAFPNRSRSFDDDSHSIRFTGHDGMFEVRFAVDLDAVAWLESRITGNEAESLAVFDRVRSRIEDVAARAYGRSRKASYRISASDF